MDSKRLISDQIKITGSDNGGMKLTQESVDFMAKHNISVETKLISTLEELQEVDDNYRNGLSNPPFRYVIDIEKML